MEFEDSNLGQIGQYKKLRQLGKGVQGQVYLAADMDTGKKVAIKEFNLEFQELYPEHVDMEVKVTQELNHDNIIRYVDQGLAENDQHYLITEYAPKGDLYDIIAHSGALSEELARVFMRQLMGGIDHLYQLGYVHRDLKLDNLMLDADFNLKIIDFGFSVEKEGPYKNGIFTTILGTPGYMAPELLLKRPYRGDKVDAFALGIILFTLVSQRPPFTEAKPNDSFFRLVHNNKWDAFWRAHSGRNKDFYSEELKDLISSLITSNPKNRMSISEISQHPWMTGGSIPTKEAFIVEMDERYTTACLGGEEI